jgi:alkylation response protein AidB-like acyl-CoA dehydrogenase
MRLEPTELTEDEQALRAEVRAFLTARLPAGSYQPGLGMAGDVDPQFSRDLGARGWLGMALPKEYGGGGRSAVDRLVVVEELLAVGAASSVTRPASTCASAPRWPARAASSPLPPPLPRP